MEHWKYFWGNKRKQIVGLQGAMIKSMMGKDVFVI